MSEAEIKEYRRTLYAFETREEKLAFWLSEIERMQARALERGVQLPDPPKYRAPGEKPKVRGSDPYFMDIMTDEEIAEYHATLSTLDEIPARRAFLVDHIMRMRARAFERGVSAPGTHDWDYLFENGVRPPDVIP